MICGKPVISDLNFVHMGTAAWRFGDRPKLTAYCVRPIKSDRWGFTTEQVDDPQHRDVAILLVSDAIALCMHKIHKLDIRLADHELFAYDAFLCRSFFGCKIWTSANARYIDSTGRGVTGVVTLRRFKLAHLLSLEWCLDVIFDYTSPILAILTLNLLMRHKLNRIIKKSFAG